MRISDCSADVCSSDLGPTGTNAVEAAIKLARKVTGRELVIAFTNGFHGMTLGALACTGNAGKRGGAGVPLSHVSHEPFDGYFGPDVDTAALLDQRLSDPSSGLDAPAAILVETVQRSEEHTSELQSLMRISYAVFF